MLTGRKLRFYPTDAQAKTLARWIGCQRFVYNAKVSEDRYYRSFQRSLLGNAGQRVPVDQEYSRYIGDDTAFLREVPSQILRNGAVRWMTGYKRFFQRLGGRPTFKAKHGRQSVMVTSELFRFDDAVLHVGTKKFPVGALDVPGLDLGDGPRPKTIYVSVEVGRWHVSFSLDDGEPRFSEQEVADWLRDLPNLDTLTIGTDLGVEVPVALSDGTLLDFTPEQKTSLKRAEKRRRRQQRVTARRAKGSKRRKLAKNAAGRCARKAADIRRDFAHKASRSIVDRPDVALIALDGVKIRNMTRSASGTVDEPGSNVRQKAGLNRSILSSAWGQVRTYLSYKALEAHKLAIIVPSAFGSQECSQCGCTKPENRPSRDRFSCTSCQFEGHADVNAALVARRRAWTVIRSGEWTPKQRKKVKFRRDGRAGTARTDGHESVYARGDDVRRKGRKAAGPRTDARKSTSREAPASAKARRG